MFISYLELHVSTLLFIIIIFLLKFWLWPL